MTTNGDLTLFNKIIDPITRNERLSRTYIRNVLFVENHGSNILTSGLESADSAKIYIPFSSLENADKKMQLPKNFKDEMTEFTIQRDSVVIKGIHTGEYTTVSELEKNFSRVYLVTTVDIHDYGSRRMWHVEVGCK